jgi:hypothetical protein
MPLRRVLVAALAIAVIGIASLAQCGPREIAAIAGKAVAGSTRQMHLFYFPPGSDVAAGSDQLFSILTGNDLKGIVLVVGSEDSAMMVAMIRRAFPRVSPGSLMGSRVVFVGSTAGRDGVATVVRGSGAEFLFAEYRESDPGKENASPTAPDPASVRRDFGFMKVEIPSGWFVRVEERNGTKAVFVTKEDISVQKQYTTGLSVNMMTNVPQRTSKKPSEYALALITQMTQKYENRRIEQSSSGPLKSSSSFLRSKGPDGQVTVQYTIASGNDRTGTVFVVIFESPEAEWNEAWKIGQALLRTLSINENF